MMLAVRKEYIQIYKVEVNPWQSQNNKVNWWKSKWLELLVSHNTVAAAGGDVYKSYINGMPVEVC